VCVSHHIGLPGLLDVVRGDDDGHFARLHDLHQVLPDPREEEGTRVRWYRYNINTVIQTPCCYRLMVWPLVFRHTLKLWNDVMTSNSIFRLMWSRSHTYLALRMGSTPTVGSSRISSSGFCSRAAPRDTRRFWPPLWPTHTGNREGSKVNRGGGESRRDLQVCFDVDGRGDTRCCVHNVCHVMSQQFQQPVSHRIVFQKQNTPSSRWQDVNITWSGFKMFWWMFLIVFKSSFLLLYVLMVVCEALWIALLLRCVKQINFKSYKINVLSVEE